MDSGTIFDDDDFFERYACGQAAFAELEAAEAQPPTPEQLAHLARFRKPVAWVVGGLALFSLLALEEHGARRAFLARYGAPRELVAHYRSALAGPTQRIALPALDGSGAAEPEELPTASPASEASAGPAALFVSMLSAMCLPECGSELASASQPEVNAAPPLPMLDLCRAPGQARGSWSLPLSMMSSSPFARP